MKLFNSINQIFIECLLCASLQRYKELDKIMIEEILVKYRVSNKKRKYLKLDRLVCDESQEMFTESTKGREMNNNGPLDKAMETFGFDLGLKK